MKKDTPAYMTVTLCQQGGIGYPPVIVRLKGRWYYVEDSRQYDMPDEVEGKLEKSKHSQAFGLKKLREAPTLRWADVVGVVVGYQYAHTVIWGTRRFKIWQHEGKVKQTGLDMPEVIETFQNTRHGRLEAGSYVSGMLRMKRIITEHLLGK